MDKKENQPREKKGMPLAPVFLLGATVLLVIEMYFIVNLPRLYLVQIILGAAILACTYVFIAALLKEIHKSGEQAKDEYERMLRGEKASYLMLKKISEQLEAVDRNTREPGEEIITAQKAIRQGDHYQKQGKCRCTYEFQRPRSGQSLTVKGEHGCGIRAVCRKAAEHDG